MAMAGDARIRRSRLTCRARQYMVIIPHILLLSTHSRSTAMHFHYTLKFWLVPGLQFP